MSASPLLPVAVPGAFHLGYPLPSSVTGSPWYHSREAAAS
jgi:hypothetical protein